MSNTERKCKMERDCLPDRKSGIFVRASTVKWGLACVTGAGVIFICSFVGVIVYSFFTDDEWVKLAKEHLPSVIGLPIAAATAFLLVSVLQVTSGKIEFECIGFKFRGASGPVVLWIACFIAIAICINLLW